MADINLLSNDGNATDHEGSASGGLKGHGAAKPLESEDLILHVPAAEPEPPAKIVPISPPAPPAVPVPPPPKPAPAAAPIKAVVPLPEKPAPKPSPPPPKPLGPSPLPTQTQPEKDDAGTLRVSLITAGAGAGFSEVALARRLRAFALFGLLGLALDGLIFGALTYQRSVVEKRNSSVEQQVEDVDARIAAREKDLKPVREFQRLVVTEADVLKNHEHWTGVLKLLEDDALPQVQFGSLAGADTGGLTFDVQSRDYTTLAKQIVAFRQDPRVLKVTVGTASADFGEGGLLKGVHSEMHLVVDPKIFKFTPQP